jgi:hypothetical protein
VVHTEEMRLALLALVLLGTLAMPASAASVDPKALVIRPSDVPAGYVLSRSESGVRTNQQEATESPEAGRLFRRLGRVTGYQMIFERGERTIEARADVFGSPASAREMLHWADRQARLAGVRGLRRARAGIGAVGWVFDVGSPSVVAYVYWQHGSVWSALGGRGMSRDRALALARVQQRRMAAALR